MYRHAPRNDVNCIPIRSNPKNQRPSYIYSAAALTDDTVRSFLGLFIVKLSFSSFPSFSRHSSVCTLRANRITCPRRRNKPLLCHHRSAVISTTNDHLLLHSVASFPLQCNRKRHYAMQSREDYREGDTQLPRNSPPRIYKQVHHHEKPQPVKSSQAEAETRSLIRSVGVFWLNI